MEHVYGKHRTRRLIQRLFRGLCLLFAGCDPCRETQLHIRAAGFQSTDLEEFDAADELFRSLITVPIGVVDGPHIAGTATK